MTTNKNSDAELFEAFQAFLKHKKETEARLVEVAKIDGPLQPGTGADYGWARASKVSGYFTPGFDDAADDGPDDAPECNPSAFVAPKEPTANAYKPQPINLDDFSPSAPQSQAPAKVAVPKKSDVKPSIFVGTPTMGGLKSSYFLSAIRLMNKCQATGTQVGFAPHEGNSLIQAARNTLMREFIKSGKTHMLMIDDDIGFDPEDVFRMLNSGHDFCAGAVPLRQINFDAINHVVEKLGMKNRLERFATKFNVNICLDGVPTDIVTIKADTGEMEVAFAGTAFLMVTRNAVDQMIEKCSKDMLRSYLDPINNQATYDFFAPMIDENGTLNGEDVSFCKRWRSTGGKIHCWPHMKFSHTGAVTISGSFIDALDKSNKD